MPGSHGIRIAPDVWDRISRLCRHHDHPGLRTAFEDAVAALERMHLRVYSGKTGVIKQLRECDRIDGQPVPMIGLPAVRLIFDVDAAMAVVRIVWFPDLPFPNNTRDIG